MKTIYFCAHCRSTNICRDAWVGVNDPDAGDTYDNTWCSDCGYDGHTYRELELVDAEAAQALQQAAECPDGNTLPESWGAGEETYL